MSRIGFSIEQKRVILKRDQVCVVHHRSYHEDHHYTACSGDLVAHHRRGRGMGGSKSRNRIANGLLVCSAANTRFEVDADFAALARERGWLLRSDFEIETQPVWVPWLNRHVFLDDDGQYLADGTREPLEVRSC